MQKAAESAVDDLEKAQGEIDSRAVQVGAGPTKSELPELTMSSE
jgi:hypothetical protein